MNYLDAKTVLLQNSPPVPFKMFAVELAAMVGIAGIMVMFFA